MQTGHHPAAAWQKVRAGESGRMPKIFVSNHAQPTDKQPHAVKPTVLDRWCRKSCPQSGRRPECQQRPRLAHLAMLRSKSPTAGSLLVSMLSLNANMRATKVGSCTGKPYRTHAPAAPARYVKEGRQTCSRKHTASRLPPCDMSADNTSPCITAVPTCCLHTSCVHSMRGRQTYTSGLNMPGMTGWKPAGHKPCSDVTYTHIYKDITAVCLLPAPAHLELVAQQHHTPAQKHGATALQANSGHCDPMALCPTCRAEQDESADVVRPPSSGSLRAVDQEQQPAQAVAHHTQVVGPGL